jgi:GxxExxY protein
MPYDDEDLEFGKRPEPPPECDWLAKAVIGAAIEVHRELGAGLPEEAYENALCLELTARRITFERQKRIQIMYKGTCVGIGKVDLLVEGKLVLENKSIEKLALVHKFQVLTYLKILKLPLGLLINYNVPVLKEGIQRVINT